MDDLKVTVKESSFGWTRVECGRSSTMIAGTRLLGLRIKLATNKVRRQEIRRLRGMRRYKAVMEKHSDRLG